MISELDELVRTHSATIEIIQGEIFVSSSRGGDPSTLMALLRPHKESILQWASETDNKRFVRIGPAAITPDLLPLIDLTQEHIDSVVKTVPGGSSNVQDIYPLAPLQEGILFHHLMAQQGDPYILWIQKSFADRPTLDRYVNALNAVIARHDILRTAIIWEGLPEPVQVVWRQAPIAAQETSFDPANGDIAEQIKARFDPRHYRLDVRRAPMMQLHIAHDPVKDRWLMMQLIHHLVDDAYVRMKLAKKRSWECLGG
jgi:hypothetical protein